MIYYYNSEDSENTSYIDILDCDIESAVSGIISLPRQYKAIELSNMMNDRDLLLNMLRDTLGSIFDIDDAVFMVTENLTESDIGESYEIMVIDKKKYPYAEGYSDRMTMARNAHLIMLKNDRYSNSNCRLISFDTIESEENFLETCSETEKVQMMLIW